MYTVVALMVLIIIGNLYFTQARRTGRDVVSGVSERVRAMDSFLHSVEKDSQRAAYISGFRSLIAMEQYVTSTGSFIANPDDAFRIAFLNGTINGTGYVILQNSTFNDYLARVQYQSRLQGMSLNISVVNVTLWQVEPWDILVNYTLDIYLNDTRGTASWTTRKTFTGVVPIVDVRDPLFTQRTYGRIQRTIKRTNITLFVQDVNATSTDANITEGLLEHFGNSTYIAVGRGPRMLDRFAGNLTDSPFGIESLVDVDEFTTQGLSSNATASVVDYKYFGGVNAVYCGIQTLPSKIKFDASDMSVYQITGTLNYTVCP